MTTNLLNLNLHQVTRATLDLTPPFLTTSPHFQEDIFSTDLTYIRPPTQRFSRGTKAQTRDVAVRVRAYVRSPDNAHSVSFSERSGSPRLIEDETFNDSDIINNLIDYEDGQEARFFESG
ncbi:hypothetical protein TNCV_440721 [Trichonephila clavipes]|nr:hypothetical protein TNCV_440721 [Trichonephila clavipes]